MIYPSLWLKENAEMRDELAKIFDIRKSGGIEVTGGILVSDGRKPIDLLNITIEKMQKFLGSKEKDENVLWSLCVDKVKQNLENKNKINENTTTETQDNGGVNEGGEDATSPEKKRGRKSRNS